MKVLLYSYSIFKIGPTDQILPELALFSYTLILAIEVVREP